MPRRLRLIGRYGNATVAVIFGLFVVIALSKGTLVFALFSVTLAALAVFNWYVIEKAARLTSEEEFLKSEVRKAELRKELADYGRFAGSTSDPPQH